MVDFRKYPKIKYLDDEETKDIFADDDDEIIVEEKADGASARFYVKDGKIFFGSRNKPIGDSDEMIDGNWRRWTEYVKKKVIPNLDELPRCAVIFYGEAMLRHTINYDWEKIPPFLGFDVMTVGDGKFVDYDEKVSIFENADLPIVSLIKRVKAKELRDAKLDDDFVPKSQYYDGWAEGVVFKNYKKQIFGKMVTAKFKETNKKIWGTSKKFAETNNEAVVATYCTNPRIDKCIFKLIDDGHKLELSMMSHLPKMVYTDIFEENWRDICLSQWSVNFKEIRKLVNKRCFEVLKQVITNNELNENDAK